MSSTHIWSIDTQHGLRIAYEQDGARETLACTDMPLPDLHEALDEVRDAAAERAGLRRKCTHGLHVATVHWKPARVVVVVRLTGHSQHRVDVPADAVEYLHCEAVKYVNGERGQGYLFPKAKPRRIRRAWTERSIGHTEIRVMCMAEIQRLFKEGRVPDDDAVAVLSDMLVEYGERAEDYDERAARFLN